MHYCAWSRTGREEPIAGKPLARIRGGESRIAELPDQSLFWMTRVTSNFHLPSPNGDAGNENRASRRVLDGGAVCFGAGRDLERTIGTHLFVICPNNSGSTFLQQVLATCRATWNLPGEGQRMFGYTGPVPGRGSLAGALKIWASHQRWRDVVTDPSLYDWPRTRRAWYFQARARDRRASVFVTKSPPHLLLVDELARRFVNSRFLFMVRNPYAVCQGICRILEPGRFSPRGLNVREAAARHVVACLEQQRRNVEVHHGRGVFFTYESMCADPERVGQRIRALVPDIDDLELRQRLPVKGRYDEILTDMNARQIARLKPAQITAFNRVFRGRRDLFDHFGYELLDAPR